ncbi:hypothetical protein HQ545_04660, partial [Candidatus Woesearchaeota archaeon]|nr:hypothetical protein [Candidatus Woesearchaeota archaeon]
MISSKALTNYMMVILAVILLFSSSVSALKEDFSAYTAQNQLNSCSCDLRTDIVTVQNTGDITSSFFVETSGEASEWLDIAPDIFQLEPGEQKEIERFIKTPCGARGEYNLNTTIKTLFDLEKSLEQTIDVQNCPNVQIIPKFSGSQEECPCTPTQYSFDVINTGKHTETYEISVDPISNAITTSSEILILDPGEKQEVVVFINLACGEYGEKTFTFNALAQSTKILGQADFALNIKKCYEYDIETSNEYAICQGMPNLIPLTVTNKAEIANQYFISVDGSKWAFPENEVLSLWGGESTKTNIIVTPPNEEETQYVITVNAISGRGDEQRTKEIVLNTEKCYDYQLIETPYVFKIAECDSKENTFILKNIGARETTYYFDVEGLEWLTTNSEPITLGAGEETDVFVSGKAPCESAGEYLENIYVTINEINQTYLEEKVVSIYEKERAYMPDVELVDPTIDYAGGTTPIKITNKGFERARYNVRIVSSDWITTDTRSISLEPEENTTIILNTYPLNETIEDTYLGELILEVDDIQYSTEFFVKLKEDRGLSVWFWILMISIPILILIILFFIVLVYLLLKRSERNKGKKSEKTIITDKKIVAEKKANKKEITIAKREYRKKKEQKDKKRFWPVLWPILLIFLILALLVTGSCAVYNAVSSEHNTTSEPNETSVEPFEENVDETPLPEQTDDGVLTNEDIQESLVTIDRSSVPGDGNELVVNVQKDIILPLLISNPTDRTAVFKIESVEDSWVSFENEKITVMPESTKQTSITIIPDMQILQNKDYAITINTTLEGKKIYYEESLNLVLTNKTNTLCWLIPALILGLVILAMIISIIAISRSAKKGKWWKISLVVVVVILLLSTPLLCTVKDDVGVENKDVVDETSDDEYLSIVSIDRSSIPGKDNVLEVSAEKYEIPVKVYNPTDRRAIFTASTESEWIKFDKNIITVEPNTEKELIMIITPNMADLEKMDYQSSINTRLEGQKIGYKD